MNALSSRTIIQFTFLTVIFSVLPGYLQAANPKADILIDFRFIRDTNNGAGRYPYGTQNAAFFDVPNVSTSYDFELDSLSRVFLAFNFDSSIQSGDGSSSIDEAWYYKNELIGKLGARFGVFPLPFSREHTGPFNSTVRTITPSVINSFFNQYRVTGMEMKKGYKVPGRHFDWRFGIASGMDTISFAGHEMSYLDWRHSPVSPTVHGSSGIFGYIGKNHSNSCKRGKLAWHGGFLLNYGDPKSPAPCGDTKLLLMDFSYEEGKFGFLFQGLAGHTNYDTNSREAVEMNFSKAWWNFDEKWTLCARYDNWFTDDKNSDKTDQGHGYTSTLSYNKTKTQSVQLEYLLARPSTGSTIDTSPLWQVRYLLSF